MPQIVSAFQLSDAGPWRQHSVSSQECEMRTVEYWRWRYCNVETGQICRTMFPCSVEEAKRLYPGAERIEGRCFFAKSMKGRRKETQSSFAANRMAVQLRGCQ